MSLSKFGHLERFLTYHGGFYLRKGIKNILKGGLTLNFKQDLFSIGGGGMSDMATLGPYLELKLGLSSCKS